MQLTTVWVINGFEESDTSQELFVTASSPSHPTLSQNGSLALSRHIEFSHTESLKSQRIETEYSTLLKILDKPNARSDECETDNDDDDDDNEEYEGDQTEEDSISFPFSSADGVVNLLVPLQSSSSLLDAILTR